MKRITALLLTVAMLVSIVVSCSDKTSPYLDSLGKYDFGGETFTVLCRNDTVYEVLVDESTGDLVNDEIYKRNLEISERFKVNIEAYTIDGMWPPLCGR